MIFAPPHKSQVKLKRFIRQFRIIFVASIVYVSSGSLVYHFVEGWRWLDAMYFSVVSLTTVGYGDLTPKTDIGKMFTMVYLILGIAIFGAFISSLLKSRVAKRALHQYEHHLTRQLEKDKKAVTSK